MLGIQVRNLTGHNPVFGKKIDQLPHKSPARMKMAKTKGKKK